MHSAKLSVVVGSPNSAGSIASPATCFHFSLFFTPAVSPGLVFKPSVALASAPEAAQSVAADAGQAAGGGVHGSSAMTPSQSSSTSSQISADGVPGTALHCRPVPFALQTSDPLDWQAPTPALQACPFPAKFSSTRPSQSSSTSLQSSADGVPGTALHCRLVPFALQTSEPLDWQAPTPALQACPFPGKSSSTRLSQSSSMSLQSSA